MRVRRPWDAYFTPESAVQTLLAHVPIDGNALECCSGDGSIARPLSERCQVFTNDLNPAMPSEHHYDATDLDFWWDQNDPAFDWVVSNPPFNVASQIVPLAHRHAKVGIAMLLRLSWLEPCADRVDFLSQYPPTTLIVLPRISFTGNGKTDSVTCAWMVWMKSPQPQRIVIERKPELSTRKGGKNQ